MKNLRRVKLQRSWSWIWRHDRKKRYARAKGLVGAFRDRKDAAGVAEEHDRYLDEAFDSLTTVDEGR